MKTKRVRETINGRTYYVHTREWFFGTTVTVTDTGDHFGEHKTKYAKTRDWFNLSQKDIETLVQETVNEAVCKREEKIKKEQEYNNKITDATERARRAHESEEL